MHKSRALMRKCRDRKQQAGDSARALKLAKRNGVQLGDLSPWSNRNRDKAAAASIAWVFGPDPAKDNACQCTPPPAPPPSVAATGKEIQCIQQLARLTAARNARNAPPFHHTSCHRHEVVDELDVWRAEVPKHLHVVQKGTPHTGVCGWFGASKGLGIPDARVLTRDAKALADENNDVGGCPIRAQKRYDTLKAPRGL